MTGPRSRGPARSSSASRRRALPALLGLALLTACGTGGARGMPASESVSIGRALGGIAGFEVTTEASVVDTVFAQGPRAVWAVLPGVFGALGIEAETVDAPSGVIGNARFEPARIEDQRLSRFLDCGSTFGGPRADTQRVTMMLLVQLGVATDGGTQVTVALDAAARPREVSGNSVHCGSRGVLERRVFELIARRMGSP